MLYAPGPSAIAPDLPYSLKHPRAEPILASAPFLFIAIGVSRLPSSSPMTCVCAGPLSVCFPLGGHLVP